MKKLYFKKLVSSLIFSSTGIFTLLFFSPLEVYLGNPTDFRVPIGASVLILGLASLILTLVFSFAVSFLPVKVLKHVNLSVLGLTLCYYVQALFLNGKLIRLDGEKLVLSASTKIINLVIWIVLLAAVFVGWVICKKLKKEKVYITATKWVAAAIAVMQITTFASLVIGYDTSDNETKGLYFSLDGRMEVAQENNVVYFVIDYCDGDIVKETLAEDPTLFDGLDGFTYYPNNVYIHGRSYPAITYLLTGEKCYYDKTVNEYINDSFKDNAFINAVDKSGADVRYYTDPRYVGAQAKPYVDNYKSASENSLSEVKPFGYVIETLKVSGFRGLPYIVKEKFAYDTEEINEGALIRKTDYAQHLNDLALYKEMKTKKVSVNEDYTSAYRFFHMYGSHPGAYVNENAEYEKGVTLPEALRGDMKIIKEYISQLKALGVYDNTTIIITADHGRFTGTMDAPQTCLMLVKPAGADSTKPVVTSEAAVSQENLYATVLEALGQSSGGYKESILTADEETRYIYHTELGSDGKEAVLQEYEVSGDATRLDSYSKTENKWEIKYSIYH